MIKQVLQVHHLQVFLNLMMKYILVQKVTEFMSMKMIQLDFKILTQIMGFYLIILTPFLKLINFYLF